MKLFKFILASLIAVFAFNLIFIVFRPGGDFLQLVVSDCLPIFCSILAVIALGAAFRSLRVWDEAKAAWLLILSGAASWTIAEAVYGFLELVLKIDASPSWADLFWIIGYLPFLAGIFLFLHSYLKSGLSFGKWKRVLIPAALAFAAGVVLTVIFALIPIQADGETGLLAKFAYSFYPLADLATLAPVIVIIYLTMQLGKGKFSLPWKLIGIGLLCFAVSDIAYSILDWQGLYSGGGITDLGWNIAYLCVALGGASQRRLLASLDEGKTMTIPEQIHERLDPLIGSNMVKSALVLDAGKLGKTPDTLTAADMNALSALLVKGLVLFIGTEKAQKIGADITTIR